MESKIYIYDKEGNYLNSYFEGTQEEIEKQENQNVFISENLIGEKGIIENGKVRAITRLDRIKAKEEELQDGEYVKDNEIIAVEKPNNFHFWDKNTNEWVYDQELEINLLEEELGSLELKIYNLEQEIASLKKEGKTFAAKKLEKEVAELDKSYQEKIKRYEELEG